MSTRLRYLMMVGLFLLVAGVAIVYSTRPYSTGIQTFVLMAVDKNALRGPGSDNAPEKRYYFAVVFDPLKEFRGNSGVVQVTLSLSDVTLRDPQTGVVKSVAKGEVLAEGQTATLQQYENDEFWNSVKVRLDTPLTVAPSGFAGLRPVQTAGNEVWSAEWTVAAAPGTEPDKYPITFDVMLPPGETAVYDQKPAEIRITSSWRTYAGWITAFLGSFATLPGLMAFWKTRRRSGRRRAATARC